MVFKVSCHSSFSVGGKCISPIISHKEICYEDKVEEEFMMRAQSHSEFNNENKFCFKPISNDTKSEKYIKSKLSKNKEKITNQNQKKRINHKTKNKEIRNEKENNLKNNNSQQSHPLFIDFCSTPSSSSCSTPTSQLSSHDLFKYSSSQSQQNNMENESFSSTNVSSSDYSSFSPSAPHKSLPLLTTSFPQHILQNEQNNNSDNEKLNNQTKSNLTSSFPVFSTQNNDLNNRHIFPLLPLNNSSISSQNVNNKLTSK